MYPNTLRIAAATVTVLLTITTADAAFNCGVTQMRHYGFRDNAFRLAKNWAKLLPHTSAHEGAIVVQYRKGRDSAGNPGGHVSRILQMRGSCEALVADEKGQYVRNICKALIAYVDPNGNAASPRVDTSVKHFSAKRKYRRAEQQQVFAPVDRLMIH